MEDSTLDEAKVFEKGGEMKNSMGKDTCCKAYEEHYWWNEQHAKNFLIWKRCPYCGNLLKADSEPVEVDEELVGWIDNTIRVEKDLLEQSKGRDSKLSSEISENTIAKLRRIKQLLTQKKDNT